MIEGIKEIGEYAIEKEGKSVDEPLEILIDNPSNRNTKNILFITFESKEYNFVYKGINIEEFSKSKLLKYAYKKGAPRGLDVTPTSMVTTVESTFSRIKILPWFKKYDEFNSDANYNFLVKIGNCIRYNKELILKDLGEKYNKENNVISLKIDGKYIGEYKIEGHEVFKDILLEEAKKGFYTKFGKISKSDNKICSVCNKRKAEVYGFVDTYKFYTVDKPGFVSGGFRQKNAWKNYPVCLKCALTLEAGRKYLGNSLNFNFYGFRYLLIPKFVTGVEKEIKKDTFRFIGQQKDPKFRKIEINRLTNSEDEVLELMSKQKNYLNLNFMFYDTPKGYDGSVFNILLYIEDILPSRLRALFEAKEEVDRIDIFKACMVPIFENRKKIGEKSLEFNFSILRVFFSRISDNRTYNKYFLDIVNKIFTNKIINYNFLMHFIMLRIEEEFINGYSTKISALKGFMLLNYLKKLKILKVLEEEKRMNENKFGMVDVSGGLGKKIDSFFGEFADFFDSNAKKAVFLEGALAQFLLNIQYQERKATPFRIRLKGLKLDKKQVKKLLPEIQNKLEEYNKNYYRELETIISGYSVSAEKGWKMSNDEISYYFVLGMNLSYLFKSENKEEKEDNENE